MYLYQPNKDPMVSHSEENMELKRNLFTYRREGCPIHGVSISESSAFIVLNATKTRYNNLYQICLEEYIYYCKYSAVHQYEEDLPPSCGYIYFPNKISH